jgi:hypothetical protein
MQKTHDKQYIKCLNKAQISMISGQVILEPETKGKISTDPVSM